MCETLRDAVAQEPALHADGATFDYALPQAWWDDFHKRLGVVPVWIVWYYPKNSIFGEAYGVGDAAKALVATYAHLARP